MTVRGKGELARYAVEDRKVGTQARRTRNLRPDGRGQVSISRVDGLDTDGVFQEGLRVAQEHENSDELHGWMEFTKEAIEKPELRIQYDSEPPRHAHIVAWPEAAGKRVHKQRLLARECHREARFAPTIFVDTPPASADGGAIRELVPYTALEQRIHRLFESNDNDDASDWLDRRNRHTDGRPPRALLEGDDEHRISLARLVESLESDGDE